MGDIISGVFGGGSREEQQVTPDEASQRANQMRVDQIEALFTGTPYASFGEERPDLYSLSPESRSLLNQISSNDNVFSLRDYIDLGIDEGKNYISKVATPDILAGLSAQGMEGSGALPEAIARATAGIALPFLQTIPGAAAAGNQANAQLLANSDIPRQLSTEDFLRRQGVVTTGLTGLPFNPGGTTVGGTRQPSVFENLFGIGSATGGTFGGASPSGAARGGVNTI